MKAVGASQHQLIRAYPCPGRYGSPVHVQAGVKTQAGEEPYESNVPESSINGLFHTYARKCAYCAPLEHLATKKKKVQCQNPRCRLSKKRTNT